MNNLSLSQEYMMCALNDKGKISAFSLERVIAVAASAVAELLMNDIIELDGKKLSVKKALPKDMSYLSPVYDFIEKKGRVGFTQRGAGSAARTVRFHSHRLPAVVGAIDTQCLDRCG